MGRVVIGMDQHKRSATIEVIDEREQVLARGRYGTHAMPASSTTARPTGPRGASAKYGHRLVDTRVPAC
jgi:hypothetical protein